MKNKTFYFLSGYFQSGLLLLTTLTINASAQQINYAPLHTAQSINRPVNVSLPVGSTAGEASVIQTSGGASYVVPIACPPGTKGMKPEIALSYSSQGANGIAGQGWNLTGISTIIRTGKNHYHDGGNQSVQHTYADAFSLDGVRLISVSGAYGKDGSIYAKEAEDFSRITSYGTSGNGPERFMVWRKDGTYMEYGGSSDSRLAADGPGQNNTVMFWRLSKMYDADGNTITYTYDNSHRDSRLMQIDYTSNLNQGLAPYNRIKFTYKERQDKNRVYQGGASLESFYLLDQILITGENGSIFKTYQLQYGYNGIGSFLNEVKELGTDGIGLNPTIFRYGEESNAYELRETNIQVPFTATSTGADGYDLFGVDTNGDSKTEILTTKFKQGPAPNTPRVHESYTIHRNQSPERYAPDPTRQLPKQTVIERTIKTPGFITGDYSGIGMDDILTYKVGTVNGRNTLDSLSLISYDPNGLPAPVRSISPQSYVNCTDGVLACGSYFGTGNEGNYIFSGDFDGDGTTDILTILNNGCQNLCGTWAFLSFPSKNSYNNRVKFPINSSSTGAGLYIQGADRVFVMDFDGDGKQEIMAIKNDMTRIFRFDHVPGSNDSGTGYFGRYDYKAVQIYEAGYPTKWHDVWLGDFNGDGKTDILTHSNTGPGDFNIGYATGAKFEEVKIDFKDPYYFRCLRTNVGDSFSIMLDRIFVADFNGDGKSDILHVQPGCGDAVANNTSKLNMYYSRGWNSFQYESFTINERISNWDITPLIADVDGDGRADFTYYPIRQNGNLRTVYFKRTGQERLLSEVRNGFNYAISFNYALASQNTQVFRRGSYGGYPLNGANPALWVVEKISFPNGIGGVHEVNYQYEQAANHRAGRGYLGFRRTTCINKATGQRTVDLYDIDPVYYVPYLKERITVALQGGRQLSRTNNFRTMVSLGGKRFFARMDSVRHQDILTGAETNTLNHYDSWGNIINQQISIQGLHHTETITTYLQNAATPVPSLPGRIMISNRRSGQAQVSRTFAFSYNPNGKLAEKKDLLLAKTYSYSYDGFGNLTGEQLRAAGQQYVSAYGYEPKGRFQVSATNVAGQSSTSKYHPLWGTLVESIGIDGLKTTYEYDGLGNLSSTIKEDCNCATSQKRVWDIHGQAIWYLETKHPGRPDRMEWYDALNRKIRTRQQHFNSQWAESFANYDARGNAISLSNSYLSSETPRVTTRDYDELNRLVGSNDFTGATQYQYHYDRGSVTIITVKPAGQKHSQTRDAAGFLIRSEDGAGLLEYSYDSWGNQVAVDHSGIRLVEKTYNQKGIQTGLKDISAGTTTYEYNEVGQLISETDANGSAHTMQYDLLGRMVQRNGPEGSSRFSYYGAGNGSANQIKSVVDHNGFTVLYEYDSRGRLSAKQRFFNGQSPRFDYTYNDFGDLVKVQYPMGSGVMIENVYDQNGFLKTVRDLNSHKIYFEGLAMNGDGHYTKYRQANGITTTKAFEHGLLTAQVAPGIIDNALSYDYSSGNVLLRKDNISGNQEAFKYDPLNRLTESKAMSAGGSVATNTIAYDQMGNYSRNNITVKSDAGRYRYSSGKPHSVSFVDNSANSISQQEQQLTWKPYHKVDKINEGGLEEEFIYGEHYNRMIAVLKENGQLKRTRVYFDAFEWNEEYGGSFNYVSYIPGGDGIAAMVVYENGNYVPYTVYKDHLGSILAVDAGNGSVHRQSFDAWGRKRQPANWTKYDQLALNPSWLYRGYTGHEHLSDFGLINMNGRIYDPLIGKMISADNQVGNPFSSTGYNRYAYANNNPLTYTDPDGNNPVAMLAIYVGVYATANLAIQASQGKVNSFGDGAKAFGIGALQGAFSYLAAGCPAEIGWQVFANAGLSVASAWMPPLTIPLGSSATLSVTPTFGFGTGAFGSLSAGFGIGARATLSVQSGDSAYSFSAGLNGYNDQWGAPQSEGVFSAGVTTSKGNAATSFYLCSWTGPTAQYSWQTGIKVGDFSWKFNNDMGFSDKYRTFSVEVGIGNFFIGSQVYTTPHDAAGGGQWVSPIAGINKAGSYTDHGQGGNGHVLGSPSYIGWKDGNIIYRFGISAPVSQDFFQNSVHKFFGIPFFEKGKYLSPYGFMGTFNPYSLY